MRILVLGAGVSGLTCALVLCREGHAVQIWTREPPRATTSAAAAAIWYPYAVQPPERATAWSLASYAEFERLARDPGTGVRMQAGIEVYREARELPVWHADVRGSRAARPEELPPGYAAGHVFTVPVAETGLYLAWLERAFRAAGGTLRTRAVTSLAEATDAGDVVVDCVGLEAHRLLGDREVFPARGQLVRVEPCGIDGFVLDEDGQGEVTYIVPRSADVILGGTYEPGVWERATDAAALAGIVERCARLRPAVRRARVLERRVGLRPCRSAVRLELEWTPDRRPVIHDYGHGGAGVTLSWGCARDVARLARTLC